MILELAEVLPDYRGPYEASIPQEVTDGQYKTTPSALLRFVGEETIMPRGVVPRQPARTGRQDRVARAPSPAKSVQKRSARSKDARPGTRVSKDARLGTDAPARPSPGEASEATPKERKKTISQSKLKGYNPVAPERVAEILKRLDQLYPAVTCALTHASAWELVVATILSAQSTDVNVNKVTPELFRKYPTVQAFAALTPEQLEPDVRSTGFFRNKSRSVVGAAKRIVAEFGGQVPDDIEKLLTLPGVARKTANVVLGT